MKNGVFIARLARGPVASTVAACLMPQSHTEKAASPPVAREMASTDRTSMPYQGTQEGTDRAVVLTLRQAPTDWDKRLEREFRRLALEELRGTLTAGKAKRLDDLNRWRDRLLCPQPAEEILLQIKRDRLLARTQEIIKDYVEFQEAAGKKRAATWEADQAAPIRVLPARTNVERLRKTNKL